MSSRSYCIISPCRDEARFARRTLEAVISQTHLPALWVIVDDGSSDQTPQILKEYADRFPWIRVMRLADRGDRLLGAGVIDAFNAGYQTINPDQFDYVCKLDLDLDIPPGYFERMIERMEQNPRIGTASGKPYFRLDPGLASGATTFPIPDALPYIAESCGAENSVGMIKFYRIGCFKQIGGFERCLMWDGIDGHRCRMLGWIAVSWDDPELRFEHLRPMGTSHKSWWTGRVRHGVGQYFMGTTPLYMLASAVYRMPRPPVIVGGIGMLWGYVKSALTWSPRYPDVGFRRFLRRYQWSCLFRGKKRATERLNARQASVWQTPDNVASGNAAGFPAPSSPLDGLLKC